MNEDRSRNQANKELIWDLWWRLNHAPVGGERALLERAVHAEIAWHGPQPINALHGLDELVEGFWAPLRASFADLHRQCDVFLGSRSGEEYWVSACGYFTGRFVRDWYGIPAHGRRAHIHFGEHLRLEHDRVVESYLILDIPSVMRQSGFSMLPPARGAEGGRVLPPPGHDGVLLTEQSGLASRQTRQLVWAMIRSLGRYDHKLWSTENRSYWHPDMHWYGPTGIGSCYSLEQYEEFHVQPWVSAFPQADSDLEWNTGRLIGLADGEILAEGNYGALGVWDCVFSTHQAEYLGVPVTGRTMTMRDFDWYRREGALIVQNWVPIDLIDILGQLGVDVFGELAAERARRREVGPIIPA